MYPDTSYMKRAFGTLYTKIQSEDWLRYDVKLRASFKIAKSEHELRLSRNSYKVKLGTLRESTLLHATQRLLGNFKSDLLLRETVNIIFKPNYRSRSDQIDKITYCRR
jgi:hypothetical protein